MASVRLSHSNIRLHADVTRILSQIEQGDLQAAEKLLPLVYDELRKLASIKLAQERPGQTLQATGLVHEAYLRLVGSESENSEQKWNSRNHFFTSAAEAMRRILVDVARRKQAIKRAAASVPLDLDEMPESIAVERPDEVIAVHDALDALATKDSVTADLVKLHYFGGFSLPEAADLLGVSRATAYRLWTYARTWLRATLQDLSGGA